MNKYTRRNLLQGLASLPLLSIRTVNALPTPSRESVITEIKVYRLRVNQRGDWYFVRLRSKAGQFGYGEASHGGKDTGREAKIESEIRFFYSLIAGKSSFQIELYRQSGWSRAKQSRLASTAFSAIEQAMWDLNGKTLGVPVHQLLGGKIRDNVKVYANINRATNELDSNGRRPPFAFQKNAVAAVEEGFRAIKMAPFDEMKPLPSTPEQIEADVNHGVRCLEAVRSSIGSGIDLLVDVHSHFNVELGISVAKRLEPLKLFWYEEPINPLKFPDDTRQITASTSTNVSGGESIFGREGFISLIRNRALDTVMPDVKHCGGILELKYIAAMADTAGISVAPHNPSGPISTAASIHAVAGVPNFSILEFALGEVSWRSSLIDPVETFRDGFVEITDRPGLGFTINRNILEQHLF